MPIGAVDDARSGGAERRQLTVLFSDLVDSTSLAEKLDPEDLRDLVASYQSACEIGVAQFGGHVAQYLGDGVLAYFGYPVAFEDSPVRAVRAGIAIVESVRGLSSKFGTLEVRVGVHTGLVVVGEVLAHGRSEQLAVGETPNLAARLQGRAEPNSVVISDATYRASRGFFEVEALADIPLKGMAKLVRVYRVTRETGALSRMDVIGAVGTTAFVGREVELGVLRENWKSAAGGNSKVVALCGEAGIGKSRLVSVFKGQIEPGDRTVFCRGSPLHQNSALYPVITLLGTLLAASTDEAPDPVDRVEQWLERVGLRSPEAVWLICSLLSVETEQPPLSFSPQKQRQQTLELLVEWLSRWAAPKGPALFVVEDLHWVDPSTLDFVAMIVHRKERGRLLVCLTHRPEFRPSWERDSIVEITLRPLERADAERMAAHVVGDKVLPDTVLRPLVERSGGVPLFIEEITKAILETGILAEREDHFELVGTISKSVIPTTTQDSLMARIDRLGPSKATAQMAAVLGREFSFDVLRAVSTVDDETLRKDLFKLVESGLAYATGHPSKSSYIFKHALIQEAAYASLLRTTRQDCHRRIAATLTGEFRDIAGSQPELVARHCEGAGLLGEAMAHWEVAGLRALERAANNEAIAHLGSALGALRALPNSVESRQKELQIQLRLAPACMAIHGWASVEVETACNRAREIAEELGDSPGLFGSLWGLWTVHFVRGDLSGALPIAERVLEMGQGAKVPMLEILGRHAMAYTRFFGGDYLAARSHAEQGLALFDFEGEKTIVTLFQLSSSVALHNILALALWCLGYPSIAADQARAAEALAARLRHRPSTAFCLSFCLYHAFHARDIVRARELAGRLYDISVEEGFLLWIPVGMLYGAWSRVLLGVTEGASADLENGILKFYMTRTKASIVQIYALVAEARWRLGQFEQALAAVDSGLAEVKARGECNYEAELHRIRGEILFTIGGTESLSLAEGSFRRAVELARETHAKSFELRALARLAALLDGLGSGAEVRRSLESLCEWFDDGIETPELDEIRRNLQGLRRHDGGTERRAN
jgi:class 3 adenylate cyclase/tetratricopeptide (TPR) repeat protein/energy-coupling factor transporter ATP-binding protein EcfA2